MCIFRQEFAANCVNKYVFEKICNYSWEMRYNGLMLFVLGKNDRYLILTAQLYDAKEMAADAKTKGDKAAKRTAQDRIRVIQQGDRNPRLKGFSSFDSQGTCIIFQK